MDYTEAWTKIYITTTPKLVFSEERYISIDKNPTIYPPRSFNNTQNCSHPKKKKLHCLHKGKGKGHPRTGYEGPEGAQMYSSTIPLTLALDVGGWSTPRPGRFTRGRKIPGIHCIGCCVGPRAGLDGCHCLHIRYFVF